MRGVYTASHRISALNAAKTLMYITAPADKVVEIISATVTNESNETNEQLLCSLERVTTLGTPTATTVTPAKEENGDQAAGSTVKANVTASEPTYGANTEVDKQGFASLAGYQFQPVPEERPIIQGQGTVGLRALNAPATALDVVVQIKFREIG